MCGISRRGRERGEHRPPDVTTPTTTAAEKAAVIDGLFSVKVEYYAAREGEQLLYRTTDNYRVSIMDGSRARLRLQRHHYQNWINASIGR